MTVLYIVVTFLALAGLMYVFVKILPTCGLKGG
jgi:hypothetical protein